MGTDVKPRVVDTTVNPAEAQAMKRRYQLALSKTADAGRWEVVIEHHRTNAHRGGSLWIVLVPTAQRR
jgi:hypothetical protein